MTDRWVHASSRNWEIVRYDRAGKWYAEWMGAGPAPAYVGPPHLGMRVNTAGRAPLTVGEAVTATVGLEATVHYGKPGGATFDRLVLRLLARLEKE